MGHRHDAGRAVDGTAEVVVVPFLLDARVQARSAR